MLRRHSFWVAVVSLGVLAVADVTAEDGGRMLIWVNRDGTNQYYLAAAYDVSHAEAMRAFADAGGAPALGYEDEQLFNGESVPGVELTGPQSWDGYMAFLKNTYGGWDPNAASAAPACDNTVSVENSTLEWTCGGLSCAPDQCAGFFYTANVRYSCINSPPCPDPTFCQQLKNRAIVSSFSTSGGTACECNATPSCVRGSGTLVPGTIVVNDFLCDCVLSEQEVPTLSEWALILLSLLVIGLGAWMMLRRNRMSFGV